MFPADSTMADEVSPQSAAAEDAVYVAVGREVGDSKAVLKWALDNRGNSSICILHVHQPDKLIPIDTPSHLNFNVQVEAHRVSERKKMSEKLDSHLQLCLRHGVQAAKVYVEMDSIQEGILKIINEKKIQKLVMGAAAQKRYSRNMIEILSEKAKYVRENAPGHTHIWFVCNNLLINTRSPSSPLRSLTGPIEVHTSSLTLDQIKFREADAEPKSPNLEQLLAAQPGLVSGPSAPDLTIPSTSANDDQRGMDTWLHAQQRQRLYPLIATSPTRSSTTNTREIESPWWDELESVRGERDKLCEELQAALDHKLSLQTKLEEFDLQLKDLQQRLEFADEMEMERDNAAKRVEELKKQLREGGGLSAEAVLLCYEIPYSDIRKATDEFDPALKIGEDGYGNIYRGFLHLTQVNVKIPHQYGLSVPREFHQEVELLCKLRHPNIVNLIGICPQSHAIIYEHCANGSLEDQLNDNDHGSPLTWHNCLKIATGLCTVLAFLHSSKPRPIIHGDLRPEAIYLDSHYTPKLVDFNISNLITRGEFTIEKMAGNFGYMDPTCLSTGELTKKSDVYSFGVVLLRLLVGKPALGIVRRAQNAVNGEGIGGLLDPRVGWPLKTAEELVGLALRCCEMSPERRLDFEPDVWRVLEALKIEENV